MASHYHSLTVLNVLGIIYHIKLPEVRLMTDYDMSKLEINDLKYNSDEPDAYCIEKLISVQIHKDRS